MTNNEHNHHGIIPVSRGIQLWATRIDSLSQLHIFNKKQKSNILGKTGSGHFIYLKKIVLMAGVNNSPKLSRHKFRALASPAFCKIHGLFHKAFNVCVTNHSFGAIRL